MLQVNLRSISVNLIVTLVTGIAFAQKGLPSMNLEETLRQRAEFLKIKPLSDQKELDTTLPQNLDLRNLQNKEILNKKASDINQWKILSPENLQQLQRSGGVDTGGGTIYRGGLLDLVLFNKEAFFDKTPGLIFRRSHALETVKIDKLKNLNSAIHMQTIAQVKKWISSSPEIAGFVEKALEHLSIYIVDGRIDLPVEGAVVPVSFAETSELRMIAYYVKDFGVFISKSDFENLSLANQKALLIHEALRHLQISTKLQGMHDLTLQKLTAKIMQDPIAHESLDTGEFMTDIVLNLRILKDQTLLMVVSEAEKVCQSSKELCYVAEIPYEKIFGSNLQATQKLAKEFSFAADKLDSNIPKNLSQEQYVKHLFDSQSLRSASNALFFLSSEFALTESLENISALRKTIKYRGFDQVLKQVNKEGFVKSEYRQLFFELHKKLGI